MRRTVLVALALCLGTSACAMNGLAFVQDRRVEIKQPADGGRVALPFELDWDAEGYDGYYAVFFDGSPMRPGADLLSVVPADDPCRRLQVCPDRDWLRQRQIFVTNETQLAVEALPDRRHNGRSHDRHTVTIVFLDDDGRRTSESAFYREFVVDR